MRAKFVFEKFTEDSDPIADMNIGMMHQIKLWMESMNEPFEDKDNALTYSAAHGKLDFVKYLLAAGADVHAINDYALRYASVYGHTEVVKVLLAAGANVHANDDGALQLVSHSGHTGVVKVLLAAGANVHANDDGALRWASNYGHTEVVKILLAAGANVHADNDLALRWASQNGYTEVVKVLKDHIAKEKRKKVKESLNEKFTEDSDPITDMGIGMIQQIKIWLEKQVPWRQANIKDTTSVLQHLIYNDGPDEFIDFLLDVRNDYDKNNILNWCLSRYRFEFLDKLLKKGAKFQELQQKAYYIIKLNGKLLSFTPEEELIVACKLGDFDKFLELIDDGVKIKIGMINSLFKHDYFYNLNSNIAGMDDILDYLRDNIDKLEKYIHPRDLSKIDKIKKFLNVKKTIGGQKYPHGYKIYRILKIIDEDNVDNPKDISKFLYELTYGIGTFNPLLHSHYWKDGINDIVIPRVIFQNGKYILNDTGVEKLTKLKKKFENMKIVPTPYI